MDAAVTLDSSLQPKHEIILLFNQGYTTPDFITKVIINPQKRKHLSPKSDRFPQKVITLIPEIEILKAPVVATSPNRWHEQNPLENGHFWFVKMFDSRDKSPGYKVLVVLSVAMIFTYYQMKCAQVKLQQPSGHLFNQSKTVCYGFSLSLHM